MGAAAVILVAGPLLAAAAYLVTGALRVERVERNASLQRALRYGSVSNRWTPGRPAKLVDGLARVLLRLRPAIDTDALARRLRAAGLARRISVHGFLALRIAVTAASLALGVLPALTIGIGRGIVLVLALGAVGYAAPGLVVAALARGRRRKIAPALPDALDLIAVCVEAGLGLDAAIQQLTEQTSGPLADELDLALSEMRVGASRQEALRNLAARLDIPELTKAVRSIAQAEQQGSALARTLGILAYEARERRQVVAEGEANKAPVKMLFPTVGFIFPALFVVVLGPALMTIYQSL
jgi:tight adherence protein C